MFSVHKSMTTKLTLQQKQDIRNLTLIKRIQEKRKNIAIPYAIKICSTRPSEVHKQKIIDLDNDLQISHPEYKTLTAKMLEIYNRLSKPTQQILSQIPLP